MMDLKDIRKIIDLMRQNDLSEFELQEEGFRIAVKRGGTKEPQVIMAAPPSLPPAAMVPGVPSAVAGPANEADGMVNEDEGLTPVKSPMVGTFYRSPSPEADAFVSVGDEIDEESVVCIVEAMKVMNEIKAEVRGTVKKILMDNASPVQYGQVLLLVETS